MGDRRHHHEVRAEEIPLMGLNLPYDFVNDTTADASPVQANYERIEAYVDAEVITRDGNTRMTAPLLLVDADPINDSHAARKSYVDAVMPVGVILPYGGEFAPGGGHWALCNGGSLVQTSYQDLFEVIGHQFGDAAAGSFLLPNLRGRFLIGVNAADTDETAGNKINAIGDIGGSPTPPVRQHQHVISHNHGSFNSGNQSANHAHNIDPAVVDTSADGAHNHDLSYFADAESGAGASVRIVNYISTGLHGFTETAPAHHHTVNIPTTKTGNQLTSHNHVVDVPNFVGNSGDVATGVTVVTKHRPPYIAISYIIRIK
jgi:microcystin-dependent protein